jgi:hypothetical protein
MLSVELYVQGVKSQEGPGDLEKLSVLIVMLHFNRLQLEDLKNEFCSPNVSEQYWF